jgi:predicted kinase
MMVGLPGSGKSTWVNTQTHREMSYVYSTDHVIDNIASLYYVDYDFIFKQAIDLAKRICNHQLAIAQMDDDPIIFWDQTNLTRKSRKAKLAQVDPAYRRVAVVVQCQDRNVWLERCKNRKGKHIPLKVLEDMEKSFEMPEESEGFKEIRIVKT